MARLRIPRAAATQIDTVALLEGELVHDTTNDNLRLGDGATLGGKRLVDAATDVTISTAMTPVVQAASISAAMELLDQGAFTATGTTTARSLADRFGDIISVKDFGATGDGSTDDTASFAAALLVGGDIFVPDGTYVLTTINLSVAGTRLFGGRGAVLKYKNGTVGATWIRLSGARTSLEGLTINGNKANVTYTYDAESVYISGANCRVRHVRLYDAQSHGILVGDGGLRAEITFNEVTDPEDMGIFVNAPGASVPPVGGLICGNTVVGWGDSGFDAAGIGVRAADWRVDANYVEQTATEASAQICIEIFTGGDRTAVVGNVCKPLTYAEFGISMAAPNTVCTGNTVYGSTEYGIEIATTGGVNVSGNVVIDATGSGISVNVQTGQECDDCLVSGNRIVNCTGSASDQAGIAITGVSVTCDRTSIVNNTITGTAAGIYTQNNNNTKIADNTITVGASTKAAIAHTGNGAKISGNKILLQSGATHTNALTVDGDDLEIDDNTIDGSSATTNGIVIASGSDNVSVRLNKVRLCTNSIVSNSTVATVYLTGNITDGVITLQSANVAWGAPWKFSANKAGTDQTGIATATPTKVTFGTEAYDIGGYFDTTNSRWTPPAGPVEIGAHFYASGLTAASECYTRIYKNGSMIRQVVAAATSSGSAGASITVVDRANGTDYYEVYVLGASGGTITVTGSTNNTQFFGRVL